MARARLTPEQREFNRKETGRKYQADWWKRIKADPAAHQQVEEGHRRFGMGLLLRGGCGGFFAAPRRHLSKDLHRPHDSQNEQSDFYQAKHQMVPVV